MVFGEVCLVYNLYLVLVHLAIFHLYGLAVLVLGRHKDALRLLTVGDEEIDIGRNNDRSLQIRPCRDAVEFDAVKLYPFILQIDNSAGNQIPRSCRLLIEDAVVGLRVAVACGGEVGCITEAHAGLEHVADGYDLAVEEAQPRLYIAVVLAALAAIALLYSTSALA